MAYQIAHSPYITSLISRTKFFYILYTFHAETSGYLGASAPPSASVVPIPEKRRTMLITEDTFHALTSGFAARAFQNMPSMDLT